MHCKKLSEDVTLTMAWTSIHIQPDLEDPNKRVPLPGDLQIASASSQGIQEKRARSTNTNPQEFTPLALRKPKRQRVQGTFN